MKEIYIESITKIKHKVSEESIKLSGLISDMLEDSDEIENIIPINFSDEIIIKIIDFCDHFITDYYDSTSLTNGEKITSDLSRYINNWYLKYIDIDVNFLGNLINAADFLLIEPLVELCCLKFAFILKENNLQSLKELFDTTDKSNEKKEFEQAQKWVYNQ